MINKHINKHGGVNMFICQYCRREAKTKTSNVAHEVYCHSNPNRKIKKPSYGMKGKKGSNQYTYGAEMSEETRKKISEASKNQSWDDERRACHSLAMQKAVKKHPESYTKNNVCGRVKIVEYSGCKLKGQWELTVAKWFDEQNIKWYNEPKGFSYTWNGSERTYFPDFYLPQEDVYIEVKGYKTDRDEAKWSHFTETLIVIDSKLINKLDDMTIEDLLRR